ELVERLGRAATLWSEGGRVFVGRDTRASGPDLEEAFARGVVSAGGNAVVAGVLPTPAVALLTLDLGAVISASHNPPEYNGVKLFDREGQKLSDEAEEEIEELMDAPAVREQGSVDRVGVATDSYLEHILERFGSDLSGLRVMVDGDQIVAILMLHLDAELVAVTVMTNLGFHRLAEEHGVRVLTTAVGDRYVLEALRREGGLLGGEQSGHIIYLKDHVTGDGLAAGLLLCGALQGRALEEAAAVMPRYPQAKANVRVTRRELPQSVLNEVERLNESLDGSGRVLVRPSGTEPLIRILAEAETAPEAEEACARISALVTRELG